MESATRKQVLLPSSWLNVVWLNKKIHYHSSNRNIHPYWKSIFYYFFMSINLICQSEIKCKQNKRNKIDKKKSSEHMRVQTFYYRCNKCLCNCALIKRMLNKSKKWNYLFDIRIFLSVMIVWRGFEMRIKNVFKRYDEWWRPIIQQSCRIFL